MKQISCLEWDCSSFGSPIRTRSIYDSSSEKRSEGKSLLPRVPECINQAVRFPYSREKELSDNPSALFRFIAETIAHPHGHTSFELSLQPGRGPILFLAPRAGICGQCRKFNRIRSVGLRRCWLAWPRWLFHPLLHCFLSARVSRPSQYLIGRRYSQDRMKSTNKK